MWTRETRGQHDRNKLRYTHDLTDEECPEVEPLIPPAKRGGHKRTVNIREFLNGLMYILGSGCQWRDIPKDLPPRARSTIISTVGTTMGHWHASITRSTCDAGNWRSERSARRPRCLMRTAREERRKGGACIVPQILLITYGNTTLSKSGSATRPPPLSGERALLVSGDDAVAEEAIVPRSAIFSTRGADR
jgi:transposase